MTPTPAADPKDLMTAAAIATLRGDPQAVALAEEALAALTDQPSRNAERQPSGNQPSEAQ